MSLGEHKIVKLRDANSDFERWCVVKIQEDDPNVWGIVAYALSASHAKALIREALRERARLASVR